jgi:hypothetical protein
MRGAAGRSPRLWGKPTYGVVCSRYIDGTVSIRSVDGVSFGGCYDGEDGMLLPGDAVVILTGDYWSPRKLTGKEAADVLAAMGVGS